VTPLDAHRARNADPDAIARVEELIRSHGVEFIYYQAVTLTGRVIAKVVPAVHLRRNLQRGILLHRTAITDLQTTRAGVLLGGGATAPEFNALPDLDTFAVLPWDESVGRFFCTLYEPEHVPVVGGSEFAGDARGLLARAHRDFEADTGLHLRSGCEPEMTWAGPIVEDDTRPGASPAYHLAKLEMMRPVYSSVIRYAQRMGLDMVEGDYEDAGQLELNWNFDRAEMTADRLVTYRLICRQVAREHGLRASFMPKPVTGAMGNGCHHNLSLWRGDVNVMLEPGRVDVHVSDVGMHAIAGLLEHASASMLVMGPTVNSYKRYWDEGQFAPTALDWGLDDKTRSIRVPAPGRIEYKLPDASVNPYLSHLLILAAIRDGLERKLSVSERATAAVPTTLGAAIHAFSTSEVVRHALPPVTAQLLIDMKTDEWARFCSTVTDWEFMMYEGALP
jgi:glutamine synthetase